MGMKTWILATLCLLAPFGAQAQEIKATPMSSIQPAPENFRFPNGKTLHYNAEWRLWTAGTATIKLEQANNLEKISASARDSGFANTLYHVFDGFESYMDPRSFCTVRLNKHIEEGFRRRETTINYDRGRRRAVLDERNPRNGQSKHEEHETPGCVTDVLGGIFYLGSLPLEIGASYVFPVNDGGKTVDAKAYVEGREMLKTDAGTFQTFRVSLTTDSPGLKGRGKIWIWYVDDGQRLPVQMRSRLFWGTLTIRLSRIEN